MHASSGLPPDVLVVLTIINLRFFLINHATLLHAPYKCPHSINKILCVHRFFTFVSSIFHCTLFRGLVGACVNPGSSSPMFLLFLNGFQPNLCQYFLHACPMYLLYYFQPEKMLACQRLLQCRLAVAITWTTHKKCAINNCMYVIQEVIFQ